MLQHLRYDQAKQTHYFAHTLTVGKHKLKLISDCNALGCIFEEFSIDGRNVWRGRDFTWLWGLLGIGVVVAVILAVAGVFE